MIIQLPSTTRVTTPPAPSLLLPTFCVSATHAINLTKGITHISNTHTHSLTYRSNLISGAYLAATPSTMH